MSRMSYTCRVCLEVCPRLYTLDGKIPNVDESISAMITYCTSEEVEIDEDLPKGVCVPCFKIVRIAYNFIKGFRETNSKLLAERELQRNLTAIKVEALEEIQISETVIDNINYDNYHIDHSYNFLKQEDTTNKHTAKDGQSSDTETVAEAEVPVANDNEPCEEIQSASEVQHGINKKLASQSLQKFECPVCLETLFTQFKTGLVRHLYRKHKNSYFKCNKCIIDTDLTVDSYVAHYTKTHLYCCPTCNKRLESRNGFTTHLKTHIEGHYFRCSFPNCTKLSRTKVGLKKHAEIHSKIPKYVCSKCGKKFITYDTFRYHLKTHDGVRSYLCNVCGRSFLQSVHLKYHMWQHTGIKQFHCADCGRSYTSITQLKKHRRKYCGSEEASAKLKPK